MSPKKGSEMEVIMEKFPEKLREARKNAEMNQTELADAVGVTQRSVTDYERGAARPRMSTIRKLAKALHVTVEYLTNDNEDDPQAGMHREMIVEDCRKKFGSKYAKELNAMLDAGDALFAGGQVPVEDMELFYDAFSLSFSVAKQRAREQFTPKSIKARKKPDNNG